MLGLDLTSPLNLLCLGAHPDDIEIGCGGTVLRLMGERPDATVRWVVFSGDAERCAEARASACAFFGRTPRSDVQLTTYGFRDAFFPAEFAAIKEAFERLKHSVRPTLILTHYRDDLHQDHRVIADLTYQTFRDHLIWEYEIPKYDGDLGNPNLYLPLSEGLCCRKIAAITDCYRSQRGRDWFTPETFLAVMRLRGIGCHAQSGLAEAFYCRKAVL